MKHRTNRLINPKKKNKSNWNFKGKKVKTNKIIWEYKKMPSNRWHVVRIPDVNRDRILKGFF